MSSKIFISPSSLFGRFAFFSRFGCGCESGNALQCASPSHSNGNRFTLWSGIWRIVFSSLFSSIKRSTKQNRNTWSWQIIFLNKLVASATDFEISLTLQLKSSIFLSPQNFDHFAIFTHRIWIIKNK